jgi:hypothetical protein
LIIFLQGDNKSNHPKDYLVDILTHTCRPAPALVGVDLTPFYDKLIRSRHKQVRDFVRSQKTQQHHEENAAENEPFADVWPKCICGTLVTEFPDTEEKLHDLKNFSNVDDQAWADILMNLNILAVKYGRLLGGASPVGGAVTSGVAKPTLLIPNDPASTIKNVPIRKGKPLVELDTPLSKPSEKQVVAKKFNKRGRKAGSVYVDDEAAEDNNFQEEEEEEQQEEEEEEQQEEEDDDDDKDGDSGDSDGDGDGDNTFSEDGDDGGGHNYSDEEHDEDLNAEHAVYMRNKKRGNSRNRASTQEKKTKKNV